LPKHLNRFLLNLADMLIDSSVQAAILIGAFSNDLTKQSRIDRPVLLLASIKSQRGEEAMIAIEFDCSFGVEKLIDASDYGLAHNHLR